MNTYKDTGELNILSEANDKEILAHLERDRYGSFLLPRAVRPAYSPKITPISGYRKRFHKPRALQRSPVFEVSASREKIIGLFLELARLIGRKIKIVFGIENCDAHSPRTSLFVREKIEQVIFESYIYGAEETILENGFITISVLDERESVEVFLDSHKIITILTVMPDRAIDIIEGYGIPYIPGLQFICEESSHFHIIPHGSMEKFIAFLREIGARKY